VLVPHQGGLEAHGHEGVPVPAQGQHGKVEPEPGGVLQASHQGSLGQCAHRDLPLHEPKHPRPALHRNHEGRDQGCPLDGHRGTACEAKAHHPQVGFLAGHAQAHVPQALQPLPELHRHQQGQRNVEHELGVGEDEAGLGDAQHVEDGDGAGEEGRVGGCAQAKHDAVDEEGERGPEQGGDDAQVRVLALGGKVVPNVGVAAHGAVIATVGCTAYQRKEVVERMEERGGCHRCRGGGREAQVHGA
jgi:hypothetical protein